jgi:hypothetical protein
VQGYYSVGIVRAVVFKLKEVKSPGPVPVTQEINRSSLGAEDRKYGIHPFDTFGPRNRCARYGGIKSGDPYHNRECRSGEKGNNPVRGEKGTPLPVSSAVSSRVRLST